MGGSQLVFPESLSLGCTDHQAKSTCGEVEGQGNALTSFITTLGGEGWGKDGRSLQGELCPGPECPAYCGGCTWMGGGLRASSCKTRKQELGLPAIWGEDPEMCFVGTSWDPEF